MKTFIFSIILLLTLSCQKVERYQTVLRNETQDSVLVWISHYNGGAMLSPNEERILTTYQDITGWYYSAMIHSTTYQEGSISPITVIR